MTTTWNELRAQAVQTGQIDEPQVAQHRAEALAKVQAYRLAAVRKAAGLNQQTLARQLGVSQSRVSRIERGDFDHTEIATLRAFAQALGGELEVTVKLGQERFTLTPTS
ncbi:XRE family transcriptional regulator [Deinococcus sp.]|uniref:XRE family transcriptional regulator n=1 Tax=Deinococcus sp. TaxID=47478 RepID=UPI0025E9C9B7|nr:XRE family transcriptional regulator [Deinococcus sp.]